MNPLPGRCAGIWSSLVTESSAVATAKRLKTQLAASTQRHLIDGKWVDSSSGETFETIDPATGEVLARVARGNAVDIDRAVRAARKAFSNPAWRRMNANDR